MDGRIQLPIAHWLKENYRVEYIDTITEPGIDRLFSSPEDTERIKSKTMISVNAHGSHLVVVSGHHDCAGNPVSKKEHIAQIRNGVSVMRSWGLPIKVLGLWINKDWEVEEL